MSDTMKTICGVVCLVFFIAAMVLIIWMTRPTPIVFTGVLKEVTQQNNGNVEFVFEDGVRCEVLNQKRFPLYVGHKIRITYIPGNGFLEEVEDLNQPSQPRYSR